LVKEAGKLNCLVVLYLLLCICKPCKDPIYYQARDKKC